MSSTLSVHRVWHWQKSVQSAITWLELEAVKSFRVTIIKISSYANNLHEANESTCKYQDIYLHLTVKQISWDDFEMFLTSIFAGIL